VTTLLNDLGDALFTAEGAGWLTLRRRAPRLRDLTPAELLQMAARSPGNVRYTTDANGPCLIEEVRCQGGLTLGAAGEMFYGLRGDGDEADAEPPADEVIEAALDGCGFFWVRRASCWSVAVAARLPREVLVSAVPGGARVTTTLAEWDEITPRCREALAAFLVAAQGGLRFARCEIDERHARVVAFAAAGALDTDLAHALLGVAAGCELLAREATALLRPEVAEIYLDMRRMPLTEARQTPSDVPAATGREEFHDPKPTEGR
jgi:hypothetical protein